MAKELGNDDWVKRQQGRIRTKGAMAAERASAGLGTSEDDGVLQAEPRVALTVWDKPGSKVTPKR